MPPSSVVDKVTDARVSTLELFFDVILVFTITQVSDLVLHAHGLLDLARAFLVLAHVVDVRRLRLAH